MSTTLVSPLQGEFSTFLLSLLGNDFFSSLNGLSSSHLYPPSFGGFKQLFLHSPVSLPIYHLPLSFCSGNILNCCEIDDALTSVWHWQQSQQGCINQTRRRGTGLRASPASSCRSISQRPKYEASLLGPHNSEGSCVQVTAVSRLPGDKLQMSKSNQMLENKSAKLDWAQKGNNRLSRRLCFVALLKETSNKCSD